MISVNRPGCKFKRLLMIAYFFPPLGGSGALRPLKLAKYLPDFGWHPVVLTVKNPDWYYGQDPGLLADLPETAAVHRSVMLRSAWIYRVLNPFRLSKADQWIRRWVLHPDPQAGWIPSGYALGMRLVRRYNIDAVYSTSAPLSGHLIAKLIRDKTGIPWVADFRDEWVENPDIPKPSRLHRKFHYQMERRIARQADHVITAASGFTDLLRKHEVDKNKITTLTMGFDPADFKVDEPGMQEDPGQPAAAVFTMSFAGLFYDSFRPAGFLKAVTSLIDDGKISPDRIRIIFVGANSLSETGFVDRYGICSFTGFVSHSRSIRIIRKSNALLLLLSRQRGGFVIPSKTFEYMAAGKPILAAVPPEGEAAGIIRRTGTGIVVDFEDREGIKTAFLRLYDAWERGENILNPNREEIACFNQIELTRRFAALVNNLAGLSGRKNPAA